MFASPPRPPSPLHSGARLACREEPTLNSADAGHVVVIPQWVIRQPRSQPTETAAPPLIRMLDVGRQSAEVRVRLYLWLWATASAGDPPSSEVRRSTGEWAVLLNLIDDTAQHDQTQRSLAARRVSRALHYLDAQQLTTRPQRNVVRLLNSAPMHADHHSWESEPLRIRASLWTNGTVSTLSAAALTVLLVLWAYESNPGEIIDVPRSRPNDYPISHSTWHRGTTELETSGLIHREHGRLIFPATNANPKITSDRYKSRWVIRHDALLEGPLSS